MATKASNLILFTATVQIIINKLTVSIGNIDYQYKHPKQHELLKLHILKICICREALLHIGMLLL